MSAGPGPTLPEDVGSHWRDYTAAPPCERCPTPAWGVCCSSHGKRLCHQCYRRTHFVEVCVEGCAACKAEGLPVVLS